MPPGPRKYVLTVPAPTPARFGLSTGIIWIEDPDGHWRNGVQWESYGCEPGHATTAACPPALSPAKVSDFGIPLNEADPFTVYAGLGCSAPSFENQQSAFDRLRAQFALAEQRALDAVVWTGITEGDPVEPHLADPAAVILGGGACLTPCAALGGLEGAFGECYGGEGVLHAPAAAIPTLASASLIVRSGERLETPSGNRVVIYRGAPATGPDGAPPTDGCVWLYMTGPLYGWRSGVELVPDDIRQALNRLNNDLDVLAERTYVISFEACCRFAIQLDASCCG